MVSFAVAKPQKKKEKGFSKMASSGAFGKVFLISHWMNRRKIVNRKKRKETDNGDLQMWSMGDHCLLYSFG